MVYQLPAQSDFYQKDIIAQQWIPWESHEIFGPIGYPKANLSGLFIRS